MSMEATTNWELVKLKDLCERITKGSTPTSYGYQYTTEGIRFIKAENIDSDGIASSTTNYIDSDTHQFLKRSILKDRDILFSIAGTIGRVGLLRPLDLPANTNQALAIVRLKEGALDHKYLFHYLRSDAIQKTALKQIVGVGRANLSLENIGDFEIPVAPLDQQKRIVAEIEKQFSRLDEAVANLKRVKANLKRYKAAVLKAAVEGKLTEEWRKAHPDVEPASKLLDRILAERRAKWEEAEQAKIGAKGKAPKNDKWKAKYKEPTEPDTTNLPELPEGWMWASLDQLSEVVRGGSPRPAGDPRYFGGPVPWITVGPLTADESDYLHSVPDGLTLEGKERSRYIEPETLLLTNSGATLGVPKITLIGGCINDGVAALLGVEHPLKRYLVTFLRTKTSSMRRINQGAAQPNLNTSIIKATVVPLPPEAEQHRIMAEVDRRLSLLRETEAQVDATLKRAERLRQSVLQRAFTNPSVGNASKVTQ